MIGIPELFYLNKEGSPPLVRASNVGHIRSITLQREENTSSVRETGHTLGPNKVAAIERWPDYTCTLGPNKLEVTWLH